MLYTVVKKNTYQDSVNLMLLTKRLSDTEGVNKISVMMGTPANMDIFKNTGLYTDELEHAGPNDICVVVDSEQSEIITEVMESLEDFIHNQAVKSKGDSVQTCRTWESALQKLPNANVALISIAGEYAASEANKALDKGLNVFIFSDNVSIKDEKELKLKAQSKGLLVMGPDCGTGIIKGVPFAFANVINEGNIGIIGASGTGIQEVSTIIARKGGGITQAIGLGGRDLSEEIGGITAESAIEVLKNDPHTKVIVFISKPPAKSVRDNIIKKLIKVNKPVVAIFIGEKPEATHDNINYAWTLEEAALNALELSKVVDLKNIDRIKSNIKKRGIKGLYSGGTLAAECAMIMADKFNIHVDKAHKAGFMLHDSNHEIIDLGDDEYTKGKPHPMIDPSARFEMIEKMCVKDETAIILLDFVIGYGGNDDMAGVTVPIIEKMKQKYDDILFIASVTGTEEDPQVFSSQVEILEEAGVIVCDTNAQTVMLCINIINYLNSNTHTNNKTLEVNPLWEKPQIINVGLRQFTKPISKGDVVQYTWNPPAGGNKHLANIVEKLKRV